LFAKQWSLTSDSTKVRIVFNVFVSIQNTISSSDSHFLGTYFPIFPSILSLTHSMELEKDVMLRVRFREEKEGILSILKYVSFIVISMKTCYLSMFATVVIFAEDVSLNLF